MTQDEKSDKVFDIINSGKLLKKEDGFSNVFTAPFDFFVSRQENDKTVKFIDMQDAIDILSEFTGIENLDKLTNQLTNDLYNNNMSITEPFALEFKVAE